MSNEKVVDMDMDSNTDKNTNAKSAKTEKTSTNKPESKDDLNSLPKLMATDLNLKHDLKFRENLYRLIISQLFYDGYQHIAVGLSGAIQVRNLY